MRSDIRNEDFNEASQLAVELASQPLTGQPAAGWRAGWPANLTRSQKNSLTNSSPQRASQKLKDLQKATQQAPNGPKAPPVM